MRGSEKDLLAGEAEGGPAFNGDVFVVVSGVGDHPGLSGLDDVEDVGLAVAVPVGTDAQVDFVGVAVRLWEGKGEGVSEWEGVVWVGCGVGAWRAGLIHFLP